MKLENCKIAIIGLGYVGLPLAIEFGKKYKVLGFDINQSRIEELKKGEDRTNEADLQALNLVINLSNESDDYGLRFSSNIEELKYCNVYIVTVPTPIDQFKAPDLVPLLKASEMLGKFLKKGDIVIFESTVYPGCTEEDCVPILERHSGVTFFFWGQRVLEVPSKQKCLTLTLALFSTSSQQNC